MSERAQTFDYDSTKDPSLMRRTAKRGGAVVSLTGSSITGSERREELSLVVGMMDMIEFNDAHLDSFRMGTGGSVWGHLSRQAAHNAIDGNPISPLVPYINPPDFPLRYNTAMTADEMKTVRKKADYAKSLDGLNLFSARAWAELMIGRAEHMGDMNVAIASMCNNAGNQRKINPTTVRFLVAFLEDRFNEPVEPVIA